MIILREISLVYYILLNTFSNPRYYQNDIESMVFFDYFLLNYVKTLIFDKYLSYEYH